MRKEELTTTTTTGFESGEEQFQKSGKYVMVMGVIQSHSPEPVLRAVKMADLSANAAIHRRNWIYEVEDLQRVLP